ncbi:MAG: hypothetical protein IKR25_03660 [Muribaculaceae bacterium]|nr:hypothetical protein [Muribaculaceae bacterium]
MNILRTLLLAVMATVTCTAIGANKLYIKSFAIHPGETKVVELYMQNDVDVRAVDMLVKLPEGLTLAAEQTRLTDREAGHAVSGRLTSRGYRVIAFSTDNAVFAGTDGPLMELTVTASDSFSKSGTITLQDIIMEDADGEAIVEMGTSTSEVYVAVPAN